MTENERLRKMLYLAWAYGNLKCDENDIYKIPDMSDEKLVSECTDTGMCVGWE